MATKTENIENNVNQEVNEQIVQPKPYLWWWVRDKKKLSIESIVEGVLSNGNMKDVLTLFDILGKDYVKQIFSRQISGRRNNYRPQTLNFFKKVFDLDV